jgi:hypothetical protein
LQETHPASPIDAGNTCSAADALTVEASASAEGLGALEALVREYGNTPTCGAGRLRVHVLNDIRKMFLDRAVPAQHAADHGCGGSLRINGYQLKHALALAWPDGDNDPQQAESVVYLEQLSEGQAHHEDTGHGNPSGLYLSFEDTANDAGLYHLGESELEGTTCCQPDGQVEDKDRPLDNCQVCRGARGGVLGNENVIAGVVVCDYCHADGSYLPKTLEAAFEMGALGAPHNEQERLRFEAYQRGHCYQVGVWNPEKVCYEDIPNRVMFSIWRDRAALKG